MNDNITIEERLNQLRSSEPAVRVNALQALGRTQDATHVGAIVWLLADESVWVRCTAAEVLGEFRHPKAVDALVQFLRLGAKTEQQRNGIPDELPIRYHSFGRERDPAYDQWAEQQDINISHDGFSLAVSARLGLHRVGVDAAPVMIDLLADENPYIQYVAVQVLNPMCMRHQTADLLLASLRDGREIVRANAARALARLGNFRAVDALIAALDDDALIVRIVATESLSVIQDKRAIAPLKALQQHDPEASHAAWLALADMGVLDDE